ncbi:MAG: alpha/beta hydrolase [Candidatus Nealsonbacteria bacterium]
MKFAFIFHGSNGSKDAHWYPWLKEELEKRELQVFLPQFPVEENQTLQNWFDALRPMKEHLGDSILIGHSLGVPFILNILNQWDVKVRAAFLVAGFSGHLEAEGELNLDDFAEREFDWNKIKQNCKYFCVIHSDDDPYVPLKKAEELASNLGAEVTVVRGGKHFQAQSGFKKFNSLLEKIEEKVSGTF